MQHTIKTNTPKFIYGGAGLMYIRYHAAIEEKANGQKKIKGNYPKFTQIEEQPKYGKGSGITIPY